MFDMEEVVEGDLESPRDAVACADALQDSVRAQRWAAARHLALAVRWADAHPPVPWQRPAAPEAPGAVTAASRGRRAALSRAVRLGAEGTPEVSEFAVTELGLLLETSTVSAAHLLRDALELRHRLPRVWRAVMTGRLDAWKARKVASATRVLSEQQAAVVDGQVVDALVGLPFGRALDVVEGRVVAVDPVGHEARRAEAARRRYVATGRRANPHGLRLLVAQTTSGDVARLDAMVAHLAALLEAQGDSDALDVRRAKALGLLANPALACVLLARCAPAPGSASEPDSPGGDPADPPEGDASPVEQAVTLGRALLVADARTGGHLLDRLRPRTVLYLHVADEAVAGQPDTQVVRTEGLGALGVEQVREWLAGAPAAAGGTLVPGDVIVLKPVLDPAGEPAVDAYEVPDRLREALELRHPYEVFPYGTRRARGADLDHTRPYRGPGPDGPAPPGQTGPHNLGPLSRAHHRAKTAGGFAVAQPSPGTFLWRSPTGYRYRVDHRGTTPLGRPGMSVLRDRSPVVPGSRLERVLAALLETAA